MMYTKTKIEMKKINFEEMKMVLLTNEQQETHEKTKICYIGKKELNYLKELTIIVKLNTSHYTVKYRGTSHIAYVIKKYSIPK